MVKGICESYKVVYDYCELVDDFGKVLDWFYGVEGIKVLEVNILFVYNSGVLEDYWKKIKG